MNSPAEAFNQQETLYISIYIKQEENSEADKIAGAIWGAGFSLPLGEPRNF